MPFCPPTLGSGFNWFSVAEAAPIINYLSIFTSLLPVYHVIGTWFHIDIGPDARAGFQPVEGMQAGIIPGWIDLSITIKIGSLGL